MEYVAEASKGSRPTNQRLAVSPSLPLVRGPALGARAERTGESAPCYEIEEGERVARSPSLA